MSETPKTEAGAATLRNVQALLPGIAARTEEIEQARSVPRDIIDSLRTAGVFRRYVPRSHGGDELWPDEAITVIEEIARADASVGWVSAVGSEGAGFYAYLPPATYDKIYASGPNVVHSGVINPSGRAVRDGDGYRFNGTWSFASGSATADLIVVGALLEDPAGGPPSSRMAVVSPSDVEILDTWYVSGLKGTGSNDIVLRDLYVPEEWTGTFGQIPTTPRHPLDQRTLAARFGLEFAAVGIGIASAAIDDVVKIAKDKVPATATGKLAGDPVMQYLLGQQITTLYTARTLLHEMARTDQASVGGVIDNAFLANRRAQLSRVGSMCSDVVSGCYDLSGTTGLFESCPLQRRLRDIRAITQHYQLSARGAYGPIGAEMLGQA